MKKITIFCLLVFFVCMGLVAEKDSWTFGVKAESWDIPVVYEPASLLKYRQVLNQKPNECIYDYEMLMNKASGNQSWQSIAVELGHSLFHKRADVFAGIGFAKVGLDMNQPEYVVNSNFITQFGESPDSQTCLGDSVSAKNKYQLFWYAGARLSILKTKSWKMGVEGRYLSFSNSDFSFPILHEASRWENKASMEFSIEGNSIKLWMAEVKAFTSLKISKNLEVSAATGYLFEKKEISGKSQYFYKQNLVNIDYNQDWKLMAKPENKFFVEGGVSAMLTRNLKANLSGSFGAKQGFSVGIQYSPGKKKSVNIVKPIVYEYIAPKISTPLKSTAPKKTVEKPVAKAVQKKTVIAPKEAAKKSTVTKKTTTTKTTTPPCISSTYTYLFRLGMRFLGFPFLEFGFQTTAIPSQEKTSKK